MGVLRPHLTLMKEDAPQREYPLRSVFNALRYLVRAGCPWRLLPNDLPPWAAVHQQTRRWIEAGVFEAMANDLRVLLRVVVHERNALPSAAIFDSRTLQSTPESGGRAGYDGYKRRKGSKVHAAVDTVGHLLALHVTPANEQDRAQVETLAEQIQERTGRERPYSLRRSGLHRRGCSPGCGVERNGALCRQTGGSQTRLRAAAQAMGGRAVLRLGLALPALGPGLRKTGEYACRTSLARLCLSDAL